MNCDLVQRRLMSSEDPQTVPADLRAHLATCGYCRDWQRHLVQIDRNIPLLPVPRSRGRARLVQRFLPPTAPAASRADREQQTAPALATRSSSAPGVPPVRPKRITWVVRLAAAAAALLLIALLGVGGLHTFHRPPQRTRTFPAPAPVPPPNPLLAGLVRHDLRLAAAATPRERIAILADVAEEMLDPTRALAVETAGSQLEALARLYERVIREGIVKQARNLPLAERRSILSPVAKRLAQAARDMDRLLQKASGAQTRPLESIAATAREGNRQLYSLVAEVRS